MTGEHGVRGKCPSSVLFLYVTKAKFVKPSNTLFLIFKMEESSSFLMGCGNNTRDSRT